MSNIYCVYLTIYSGNKLPPFYIGWSSKIDKVTNQQYHGSISSKQYKNIYKDETLLNPHLFKSIILAIFSNEIEAKRKEEYFHKKLDVINNPLYMNKGIGWSKLGGSGEHHPRYGSKHAALSKSKMKKSQKERIKRGDHPFLGENGSKLTKNRNAILWEENRHPSQNPNRNKKISETNKKRALLKLLPQQYDKKTKERMSKAKKNTVACKDLEGNIFRVSKEEFDKRRGIDLFGQTYEYKVNQEVKTKISETLRKNYENIEYKNFHKERINNPKSKIKAKHKIRESILNGTHSTQISYTCPQCNKIGKGNRFKSLHFDNCKYKPK